MGYRLLSTEECTDGLSCPSVWADDLDPDHVLVVGKVVPPGTVPVGADETVVRIRRRTIVNAELG